MNKIQFAIFVVVAVFITAVLIMCVRNEYVAANAGHDEAQREWTDWQREHRASPETWAACRAVCGESAALLPQGHGAEWVTCSCVPAGSRVEVR